MEWERSANSEIPMEWNGMSRRHTNFPTRAEKLITIDYNNLNSMTKRIGKYGSNLKCLHWMDLMGSKYMVVESPLVLEQIRKYHSLQIRSINSCCRHGWDGLSKIWEATASDHRLRNQVVRFQIRNHWFQIHFGPSSGCLFFWLLLACKILVSVIMVKEKKKRFHRSRWKKSSLKLSRQLLFFFAWLSY